MIAEAAGDIGQLHADEALVRALMDAGMREQIEDGAPRRVRGDRETDALRTAAGGRLVDADDVRRRYRSSGPPELPGLIGAEVCSKPLKSMTCPSSFEIGSSRLKAETTPTVTVCWSSSGSPMAIAHWPCCRRSESANSQRRRQLRVVVDLDEREVGADRCRDDVRRYVVAVREHDVSFEI